MVILYNWCHNTQHNGIQRNDTQYKGLIYDTQHNYIKRNDTKHKGLIHDTQDK
jgi:hypothetical protein